jgi:hypothetical protein
MCVCASIRRDPVAVEHQVTRRVHVIGVVHGQHRAALDDDHAMTSLS